MAKKVRLQCVVDPACRGWADYQCRTCYRDVCRQHVHGPVAGGQIHLQQCTDCRPCAPNCPFHRRAPENANSEEEARP